MRICFIGDSVVAGTGDDDCLGWVGRLCARARQAGRDLTPYNLGVRRETSADIAARWRREAKPRLPDGFDGRLVFAFGVNDCVIEGAGHPRIPAADSMIFAETILADARRWLPTLMVGPPPTADAALNARIGALSTRLEAVCQRLDVPFLAVFPALEVSEIWMRDVAAGDGAHPNAAGYAVMAEMVAAWDAWRNWLED
jgi:lysophospholipase L1-like esterase